MFLKRVLLDNALNPQSFALKVFWRHDSCSRGDEISQNTFRGQSVRTLGLVRIWSMKVMCQMADDGCGGGGCSLNSQYVPGERPAHAAGLRCGFGLVFGPASLRADQDQDPVGLAYPGRHVCDRLDGRVCDQLQVMVAARQVRYRSGGVDAHEVRSAALLHGSDRCAAESVDPTPTGLDDAAPGKQRDEPIDPELAQLTDHIVCSGALGHADGHVQLRPSRRHKDDLADANGCLILAALDDSPGDGAFAIEKLDGIARRQPQNATQVVTLLLIELDCSAAVR